MTDLDHATTRTPPPARSGPLAALLSPDPLDVVPRVAPLLVLPSAPEALLPLLAVGYALVVLVPRVYRSPWLWFGLAAVHLIPLLGEWQGVDNHKWLIGYLLLALGTSFLTSDPRDALARQGALLIALTFGLAVLWKAISGQYLSGAFFHHAFLADPRFEPVARLLGQSDATIATNGRLVAEMRAGGPGVELGSSTTLRVAAGAVSWWGWLLELAIAVGYALPMTTRLRRLAPALLLVFVLSTYAVVPVMTFGLTLALFAYPSLPETRRVRRAWLATVGFVIVWGPIWRAVTGVDA